MTAENNIYIYDTVPRVAEALANNVIQAINAIEKDVINIAISGGNTPASLFNELANENNRDSINWVKVHLYWTDERCVSPTDNESNYGIAKKLLISKINIPEKNIHRIRGEDDPEDEARRYENLLLKNLPLNKGFPVFDFALLGVGEDGHTASIFPMSSTLNEDQKLVVTATHPVSHQNRISLILPVIQNSVRNIVLVTGSGKSDIMRILLKEGTKSPRFPISLLIDEMVNIEWWLDKEAGKYL